VGVKYLDLFNQVRLSGKACVEYYQLQHGSGVICLQSNMVCVCILIQGTKEDYEKCITAAKEAWNIWADVSLMFTEY